MARHFITSTIKHYCARCRRAIPAGAPYRRNAAQAECICKPCVQEQEIVHVQEPSTAKRAARIAPAM